MSHELLARHQILQQGLTPGGADLVLSSWHVVPAQQVEVTTHRSLQSVCATLDGEINSLTAHMSM